MCSHSPKRQTAKPGSPNPYVWRIKLVDFRWVLLAWAVLLCAGGGDAATGDVGKGGPTVTFVDGYLTVDASNAPTATVLRRIALNAAVNIAVYGEPEGTMSVKFESLRLDDALHRLLGRYNLVLLYKEVKDPPPGGPRVRLTGVQVHVDPGANAPTLNFEAGQVIEKRRVVRKREKNGRRSRKIKDKGVSETGLAAVPGEDSAEALARLKVAAFDADPSVRADAVDELTMVDDEGAATDILERVLREDPSPEVRANAISGLEDLDAPPVETVLDAALFDESPEVRIGAMEIIGDHEWKDQRTVDTLSRVLSDPNEEIRLAALEVLGDLEERSVLEVAARSNPNEDIRELAAELLTELKP